MNSQASLVVGNSGIPVATLPLKEGSSNEIVSFTRKTSFLESVKEVYSASSFKAGMRQVWQEVLMQFIPKALVSLLSGRIGVIGYEALLESSEYVGLYLFPTLVAAGGAKIISKILNIPHFSLLGVPYHQLEHGFKNNTTINNISLNKNLLARCAIGQLMVFALTAIAGIAAQLIATAPRVLFINNIAGDTNFYTLSGLKVSKEQKEKGEKYYKESQKHAWQNLIWGIMSFLGSIPLILGLTFLLGKNTNKLPSGGLDKMAKTFMLDGGFGISKFVTVFNLAIAPWAYGRTALSPEAKDEDLNRLFLFSIPAVLFFQQFLENIFTFSIGKMNGISQPLLPFKEAQAQIKAGEREIWNISLYNEKHIQNQIKNFPEHKQAKILKNMKLFNNQGVLSVALLWGLGVQIINLMNTKNKHAQELQTMSNPSAPQLSFAGLTSINN